MPVVTLPWNGQTMYAPTRDEYKTMMREAAAEEARQRAADRAKKRMEFTIPIAVPGTATFIGDLVNEGYIWSLKLIGVTLAASGTVTPFKASTSGDARRPLANVSAAGTVAVFTWSSDQARLRHSDGLYLPSSSNVTEVFISGWEVPAEREAEIYD